MIAHNLYASVQLKNKNNKNITNKDTESVHKYGYMPNYIAVSNQMRHLILIARLVSKDNNVTLVGLYSLGNILSGASLFI